MKTQVTIRFYKESGKYYDSFTYDTDIHIAFWSKIKTEAMQRPEFIKNMDFIMEVSSPEGGWNSYLYPIQSVKDMPITPPQRTILSSDQIRILHSSGVRMLTNEAKHQLHLLAISDTSGMNHERSDEVLCNLLNALGFESVVEEYNKIQKWYE